MNFVHSDALSLFRPRERPYYQWQFFKASTTSTNAGFAFAKLVRSP
jgi:hypothetical protein